MTIHEEPIENNPSELDEHNVVDDASEAVQFADFDLPPSVLKALDSQGFTNPTEVQEQTLEIALSGQDLMVSAQTGSGKTVAFLLPCLTDVINNMPPKNQGWHKQARPQALIICPTRELVEQVTQDAIKLVKFTKGMRIGCIMGGMPYGKQLAGLKGARIVVATPGRLLDLANRGQIQLNNVSHLVLDEADRMLDLGFQEDLNHISELCLNREQTLLFSATFADNIIGLAKNLMQDPKQITLAKTQDKHDDITQSLYYADNNEHKKELLNHWLKTEEINQAVIFVPTQVECDSLTEKLREEGQNVISLHGGMRQFMRMKRLKMIRSGKVKILVATDVAARGLDVPSISHVINYGLPMKHEDYVHRIGRTGRAGRKGNAITVATHRERGRVRALQQFIAQDIEVMEVAGLEPSPPPKRKPNDRKRSRRPNNRDNRSRSNDRRSNDGNRRSHDGNKKSYNKDSSFKSHKKQSHSGDSSENRRHGENKKPYSKDKSGYRKKSDSGNDRYNKFSDKPHKGRGNQKSHSKGYKDKDSSDNRTESEKVYKKFDKTGKKSGKQFKKRPPKSDT